MIGMPDRSYLWIMSRTPLMEADVLEAAIAKAVYMGYDEDKIVHLE